MRIAPSRAGHSDPAWEAFMFERLDPVDRRRLYTLAATPADARGLRVLLGDQWKPARPWPQNPVEIVDLRTLAPTQWPHYSPCRLCQQRMGRPVEGDDPYPHVIDWQGQLYVWDGHTRVAGWLRVGRRWGVVRVAPAV